MKKIKKATVSLFAAVFLFACSDNLLKEDTNLNFDQDVSVTFDEETFVSLEQAANVAEMFLRGEIAKNGGTKSLSKSSIETVIDKNNPAMYVVNYPEGGWVIVGATKNYYPVLAYNDEGYFDLDAVSLSGVSVWMEETKDAIRESAALDDSTKVSMNFIWQSYEKNQKRITSESKNYTDMLNRILYLQSICGSGWDFIALEDASWVLDSYNYQALMDMATAYGYSPEYSIIGYKDATNITNVNPKLSTQWHQGSTYNGLCNGCNAGCTTISLAQIFRYFQYPSTYTYNGYTVNWGNMNGGTYDTQVLIRSIGDMLSINYNNCSTGANDNNIKNVLNYTGYSYTLANHNATDVKNALVNNKLVSMGGYTNQILGIPSGSGHQWVCDGVTDYYQDRSFCLDFYSGGSYYTYIPYNQPGHVLTFYTHFYMNWGWGGSCDGWFGSSNVNSGEGNFQYGRTNFYIWH
jgi:hypothetical protein